jgi:hypothetical protein
MTTDTLLGRFVAPGSPVVDLRWADGVFLAGGETVPASRVASWDDAGYVEWVSEATGAWFARERAGGFALPRESAGAVPVPQPGGELGGCAQTVLFVGATVAWAALTAGLFFGSLEALTLAPDPGDPWFGYLGSSFFIPGMAVVLFVAARVVGRYAMVRFGVPRAFWAVPVPAAAAVVMPMLFIPDPGPSSLGLIVVLLAGANIVCTGLPAAAGARLGLNDVDKAGQQARGAPAEGELLPSLLMAGGLATMLAVFFSGTYPGIAGVTTLIGFVALVSGAAIGWRQRVR